MQHVPPVKKTKKKKKNKTRGVNKTTLNKQWRVMKEGSDRNMSESLQCLFLSQRVHSSHVSAESHCAPSDVDGALGSSSSHHTVLTGPSPAPPTPRPSLLPVFSTVSFNPLVWNTARGQWGEIISSRTTVFKFPELPALSAYTFHLVNSAHIVTLQGRHSNQEMDGKMAPP